MQVAGRNNVGWRSVNGVLLTAALCAASACQAPQKAATRPTTQQASPPAAAGRAPGEIPPVATAVPADPRPVPRHLTQMDVYVLSLPHGAVSRNEEFWKRVNEDGLDPQTYDVLFRNGVRAGEAAVDDWPYFKEIIDAHPAATQLNSFVAVEARALELPVRQGVPVQNIFHFDREGRLSGRTHEQSDNLWTLAFLPTPRKEGYVHVILCPMVREQRKRLEVRTVRVRPEDPPEREITYTSREQLLDVNLKADIPPGKFLVVAPSSQAGGGSVGDAFLGGDGAGQRIERVMLLVPKSLAVQGVRTEVRKRPN